MADERKRAIGRRVSAVVFCNIDKIDAATLRFGALAALWPELGATFELN